MQMPVSAFVIAGTESGVGKTAVTIGLIGALRSHGYDVQPFKVGPDFIDTSLHTLAAGVPSRNLDTFMMPSSAVVRSFHKNALRVNIVEGVMGLFDGSSAAPGGPGSTAHLAKLLDLPIVLVVNASKLAGSIAALVHGYKTFDPALRFAGVILNGVGGERHARLLETALKDVAPVIGSIPTDEAIKIPERHLGLFMSHEVDDTLLKTTAEHIEKHVEIERLVETTETEIAREQPRSEVKVDATGIRVGVANDEAFCFYYPENLEVMRDNGAEIVTFSPIRDALPDADAFYLGGGYPELYATQLEDNASLREALRNAVCAGAPLYAECGGMLYCLEHLEHHEMLGLFKGDGALTRRLQAVGYVDAVTKRDCLMFPKGTRFRGHEFHYSSVNTAARGSDFAYKLLKGRGIDNGMDGLCMRNVLASYTHIHALGNEAAFLRLLDTARLARP